MQTGRSPVAKGSSVPRCPTFRWRRIRLTAATTAADVMPAGLSTSRTPCRSRPLLLIVVVIRACRPLAPQRLDFPQQVLDTLGSIDGGIDLEPQFRGEPQPE